MRETRERRRRKLGPCVVTHLGSRIHGVERPGKEGHPGRNVQDKTFLPKTQRSKVLNGLLPDGTYRRERESKGAPVISLDKSILSRLPHAR